MADAGWAPADFSTRGPYVDIAAPGRALRSGDPGGGYGQYEGASFATPLIAGAQALWRQQNPAATPAAIAQALTDGARPLFDATSAPYPADAVGAGMVDVSVAP